jgi:hypothetical protein
MGFDLCGTYKPASRLVKNAWYTLLLPRMRVFVSAATDNIGRVWLAATTHHATLVTATDMMVCVCLACHVCRLCPPLCRLCPPLQCDCGVASKSTAKTCGRHSLAWRVVAASQTRPKSPCSRDLLTCGVPNVIRVLQITKCTVPSALLLIKEQDKIGTASRGSFVIYVLLREMPCTCMKHDALHVPKVQREHTPREAN